MYLSTWEIDRCQKDTVIVSFIHQLNGPRGVQTFGQTLFWVYL